MSHQQYTQAADPAGDGGDLRLNIESPKSALRRSAWERGYWRQTFATADEYRDPDYAEGWAAGAAARDAGQPNPYHVEPVPFLSNR